MALDHREIGFEAAIEHYLLNAAGYANAGPTNLGSRRAIEQLSKRRSALISGAETGKIDVRGEA